MRSANGVGLFVIQSSHQFCRLPMLIDVVFVITAGTLALAVGAAAAMVGTAVALGRTVKVVIGADVGTVVAPVLLGFTDALAFGLRVGRAERGASQEMCDLRALLGERRDPVDVSGELRRGDAADRRLESDPGSDVDRRQRRGPRLRDVRRVEVLRSEERVVGDAEHRVVLVHWIGHRAGHRHVHFLHCRRERPGGIEVAQAEDPGARDTRTGGDSGHQYLAARRPSGGRLLSLRAHSLAARTNTLRRRYARPEVSTPSLWRHSDFLKLWTGQTISRLGSVVTRTALPLVALLVLGAGPREMAYLVISSSLGTLLVGLVAGAWVDRLRRRPILIWTDIIRAALLFWVPVAYAIGALRIEQLYAVAFIEACLASLFNSAYPAYVPSLIGTDRVVDANSKLATSSSIAEIGGPGLAGTLVQIAGAPFAILVDAFSFVATAVSLALIRSSEPLRPTRDKTTRIAREIIDGLLAVRRHAIVFPLALRSILGHVFGSFYGVLYS